MDKVLGSSGTPFKGSNSGLKQLFFMLYFVEECVSFGMREKKTKSLCCTKLCFLFFMTFSRKLLDMFHIFRSEILQI